MLKVWMVKLVGGPMRNFQMLREVLPVPVTVIGCHSLPPTSGEREKLVQLDRLVLGLLALRACSASIPVSMHKKLNGRWCGIQLSCSIGEWDWSGDCSYLWRPFVIIAQMSPQHALTWIVTFLEKLRQLELPNSLSVMFFFHLVLYWYIL